MKWNPAQPELIEREHDLPPKWDGAPVEWGPWIPAGGPIFICGPRRTTLPQGCSRCGSTLRPQSAAGHAADGLVCLIVTRCEECELDTVVEVVSGNVWDLDASDYGDAGSVA